MVSHASRPADTGSLVVGASGLLVVIGAFLGWFTVPVGDALGSIQGLDLVATGSPIFNGLVTVLLATLVTGAAILLPDKEAANVLTTVGGLSIELIAVTFVLAPEMALGTAMAPGRSVALSNVGLGVYLTLVGGLGVILGGFLSYRR
jgi:hypothetical protein